MNRITHAKDALQEPGARLTADEHAIVDKLVQVINSEISTKVRRHGFEFDTNNTNPSAQLEVNRLLQKSGWIVQCSPLVNQPRFQGAPPIHVGYKIICVPAEDALEAADEAMKKTLQ